MYLQQSSLLISSLSHHTFIHVYILLHHQMNRDRYRWRLHAIANEDIDLQAWYHALFFMEVSK